MKKLIGLFIIIFAIVILVSSILGGYILDQNVILILIFMFILGIATMKS